MDADAYAMSHILYTVEVYYNDRNLIQGKFITSKEMMCEILLNSIIIVHLILQDVENISIEDTLYSTHLPASYRLILAADSLRTAIKNTPSTMGTYDSISEQFYKSIGTCMNIYNEIWDKSKTAEDLANDLLSFDKYYDPIKNNWDALRDILIRYSYIELPPKYSSNK